MEEKDIDLIDRYLSRELTEDEATAFQERLADDQAFAQLAEDMTYIQKGLQQVELEKAWQVIQDAEDNSLAESPITQTRSKWALWVGAAASVVLVIVAAWYFTTKSTPEERLYAQYFEAYPNVEAPVYRSSDQADTTLSAKEFGFERYEDEDYEGAIAYFESIPHPDEGTLFYLGLSYLSEDKPEKAVAIWEPLMQEANIYKTQIEWYLGLAWLKMEELPKARKAFEDLSKSGTAYEERSKAILKAL